MKLGEAPDHLGDDERLIWSEIALLHEALVDVDLYLVEMFCCQLTRWRWLADLERKQRDKGCVDYNNGNLLSGAAKSLQATMVKLCLTPADRKKVMPSTAQSKSAIRSRWESK